MLEISIFYLIGTVVVLPSITYFYTRRYYNHEMERVIREFDKSEITIENIHRMLEGIDETNLFDEQKISPIPFSYQQKREFLEEHFKKINNQ